MAKSIYDSDTAKIIAVGLVVAIIGPPLLRKLLEVIGGSAADAANAVTSKIVSIADNAANDVFSAGKPTEYVGGNVSWQSLVSVFGEKCANSIVNGGAFDQFVNCPLGWQNTVKAMNLPGLSGLNGMGEYIDLTKDTKGVYK